MSQTKWVTVGVPPALKSELKRLAIQLSAERGLDSSVGVGTVIEMGLRLLAGEVTREQLFGDPNDNPVDQAQELGVLVHTAGRRGWPKGVSRGNMKQRKLATLRELCLCPPEWPIERPTQAIYWKPPLTMALNPWCPMHTDPGRIDRILSPGGLAHAREVSPTKKMSDEELAAQLPVAVQNATSRVSEELGLSASDWGLDEDAAEKLRGFGPLAVKAMTKRWVMPSAIQEFFDVLFLQIDRS